MKEILDVIIVVLFAFMVFMFIKGFNKQQIDKYTKKLEENEQKKKEKESIDE